MVKRSEITQYLCDMRLKKEPFAVDFYKKHKNLLGVSYATFKHFEAGTRLPPLEYLSNIAPLIGASLRTLCHLWARAQMPNDELKSFFNGVQGYSDNIPMRARPEETYRFSRSESQYLLKFPKLYFVAVYMGAYFDSLHSIAEVMKFADMTRDETTKLLQALDKLGLVIKVTSEKYKSRFKVFDIPRDDEEFKEIRNNNFLTISGKVLKNVTTEKRNHGEAQRFTFSTRMTPEIQRIIQAKLTEIESFFDTIPAGQGDRMGSVCLAFSDYVKKGERAQ